MNNLKLWYILIRGCWYEHRYMLLWYCNYEQGKKVDQLCVSSRSPSPSCFSLYFFPHQWKAPEGSHFEWRDGRKWERVNKPLYHYHQVAASMSPVCHLISPLLQELCPQGWQLHHFQGKQLSVDITVTNRRLSVSLWSIPLGGMNVNTVTLDLT